MGPRLRAIDALIDKYRDALRLIPADSLPAPVYGFDPTGWLLFRVDPEGGYLGRRVRGNPPNDRQDSVSRPARRVTLRFFD
jgi:hypothetical protein